MLLIGPDAHQSMTSQRNTIAPIYASGKTILPLLFLPVPSSPFDFKQALHEIQVENDDNKKDTMFYKWRRGYW